MTTETVRNEAAERLRQALAARSVPGDRVYWPILNEALAAERRATVERIRERLAVAAGEAVSLRPTGGSERERQAWANGLNEYAEDIAAILDEEAR